ncbi:hypothetical protein HOLleu_40061 [Holothuria leucospilota]|uniref:Uncharacterized protein n=1 Tax=Holothuria leucospilota TaxID=206669 RepID=A0A9Q1BCH7_HOLLE|nr:hypothetical protein HOLleu_40061 [Holothuria leucospilota]
MDPQKRRHHVAQKMRESARLLVNFRSLAENDASMDDMLSPQNYNNVIKAVEMTGGVTTVDSVKHPSTILKLGNDLQKLAKVKRALSIIAKDNLRKEEANDFIQLVSTDFTDKMTAPALSTLRQRKFEKANDMPESEDVHKFSKFLSTEVKKSIKILNDAKDHGLEKRSAAYRRAQHLALAKLTFFNKRRTGETEQLSLKAYNNTGECDIKEIMDTLSPVERELCRTLKVVFIRGKRGRKVPLIIPQDCAELMDLLRDLRQSAGISSKNKYFFGRFGARTPIRATDSLRELTLEAQLNSPHLVRSTKMRKYTATLSQVFSLEQQHTEWLTEHLGHSVKVHREHYRLPSSTIEKAKIAKLLLAIDSGLTRKFYGKSLDEITFDGISL